MATSKKPSTSVPVMENDVPSASRANSQSRSTAPGVPWVVASYGAGGFAVNLPRFVLPFGVMTHRRLVNLHGAANCQYREERKYKAPDRALAAGIAEVLPDQCTWVVIGYHNYSCFSGTMPDMMPVLKRVQTPVSGSTSSVMVAPFSTVTHCSWPSSAQRHAIGDIHRLAVKGVGQHARRTADSQSKRPFRYSTLSNAYRG